jgi:RNA polymerase sigma-70 factor (ECF subfamily)
MGSGGLASSLVVREDAAQRELLAAALNGDEHAFRHLVEPHRTPLLGYCHRVLGSLDDAEDAFQDTLLKAWRGLSGFERRSALRGWLYRIATNACLDVIAQRRKRVLSIDSGQRTGPVLETLPAVLEAEGYAPETCYEQREAVGLAFAMALQHLPPRQRAVLVLREVLGFSAREVSRLLGLTVTSVNSALQRARRAIDERVPEKSQDASVRARPDAKVQETVQRFVNAFERGDVEAIIALLAEDVGFGSSIYARRKAVTPTIRGAPPRRFQRYGLASDLAA